MPPALRFDEEADAVPKQVEKGGADRREKAADKRAECGKKAEKIGDHAKRQNEIEHRAEESEIET